MESCPDCTQAKQLYGENPDYEIIDIGKQARSLKEFLVLRDNHPAFAKVRERGTIGIPCFVKEDGTVDDSKDFFGKVTSLTVSGQLNAENFAMEHPKDVQKQGLQKKDVRKQEVWKKHRLHQALKNSPRELHAIWTAPDASGKLGATGC